MGRNWGCPNGLALCKLHDWGSAPCHSTGGSPAPHWHKVALCQARSRGVPRTHLGIQLPREEAKSIPSYDRDQEMRGLTRIAAGCPLGAHRRRGWTRRTQCHGEAALVTLFLQNRNFRCRRRQAVVTQKVKQAPKRVRLSVNMRFKTGTACNWMAVLCAVLPDPQGAS